MMYLNSMVRTARYLLVCGMVLAAAVERTDRGPTDPVNAISFLSATSKLPAGASERSRRPVGKGVLSGSSNLGDAPRTGASVKEILSSKSSSTDLQFTLRDDHSPVTEFTQGRFHRYRPRDPTSL